MGTFLKGCGKEVVTVNLGCDWIWNQLWDLPLHYEGFLGGIS